MSQIPFFRPGFGEQALVLVPKVEHQFKWQPQIKGGSAIVGYRVDEARYFVCYEGNIYHAENLKSFRERALVAYGRLTQRAGTVASCFVDVSDFEETGKMTNTSFDVSHGPAIDEWMSRDSSLASCW